MRGRSLGETSRDMLCFHLKTQSPWSNLSWELDGTQLVPSLYRVWPWRSVCDIERLQIQSVAKVGGVWSLLNCFQLQVFKVVLQDSITNCWGSDLEYLASATPIFADKIYGMNQYQCCSLSKGSRSQRTKLCYDRRNETLLWQAKRNYFRKWIGNSCIDIFQQQTENPPKGNKWTPKSDFYRSFPVFLFSTSRTSLLLRRAPLPNALPAAPDVNTPALKAKARMLCLDFFGFPICQIHQITLASFSNIWLVPVLPSSSRSLRLFMCS